MTLKNGTEPADPRLGRLPHFDERSRGYPIMATMVTPAPPRSYTWGITTPPLDQGAEGSCVGHAWAHELQGRPVAVAGIDHTFARERIYWEAQKVDPWPGGAYPGASPQYEGTAVLAGAKVVQALGAMSEYRWAFSIDELALAIGYKGPAVLGIPWYESMFTPDADGVVHVDGGVAGGHAILCRGVSIRKRQFRLRNSWGAWGINGSGDCLISFDDLDRLLHEDGEACIPMGRKAVHL